MGNLSEIHDMENTALVERWEGSYGRSWVYRGFLGGCRSVRFSSPCLASLTDPTLSLITTDLQALSYILSHAYEYPKPDFIKDTMASMGAGYEGLITVDGDVHKRQRKILVRVLFLWVGEAQLCFW